MSIFAAPGDDNQDGTLEGNDPTGAPIESNLFTAIIIIGIILFCLKKFHHLKKMEQL